MRQVQRVNPQRVQGCPYDVIGSFPWYRELDPVPTQQEAWDAAVKWSEEYRKADRYGNMANAFGFVKARTGTGWCGVVNYFHSNT
jgi:hypothetical protein